MKNHECDEGRIAEHEQIPDIDIYDDGEMELCVVDHTGMDNSINIKCNYCPFCGIKFPAIVFEYEEEPAIRSDCKCLNTYHGVCMRCGRTTSY